MSLKQLETVFINAIGKTKELLFPFSLKKWVILVFIALLAGALGGGGGSVDVPFRAQKPAGDVAQPQGNGLGSEDSPKVNEGSGEVGVVGKVEGIGGEMVMKVAVGLIVFLFFIIPFWLLFLWISSRFAFIFYNSAISKTAAIKVPWARYKMQGNSLFKTKIVLSLFVVVIGGVLGGLTLVTTMGGDYTPLLIFIPIILVYIFSVVIMFHYVDQFIVPIMVIENKNFSESFAIFGPLFRQNKKLFIVYIFVAVGLGLVCGVLAALVMLGVFLLYAIIGLVIFGGAYAIFGTGTTFVLICVVLGIPFVLALILTICLVLIPIPYFYRNFTLYYLMESTCNYDFYTYGDGGNGLGDDLKDGLGIPPPLPPLPSLPSSS